MQITFDPHNQSEAEEVLALLKGDDWTKSIDVPVKAAEPEMAPVEKEINKKETSALKSKEVTLDDIRAYVAELIPRGSAKRKAAKEIFIEFGNGTLKGLSEDKLPEVYKRLKELKD